MKRPKNYITNTKISPYGHKVAFYRLITNYLNLFGTLRRQQLALLDLHQQLSFPLVLQGHCCGREASLSLHLSVRMKNNSKQSFVYKCSYKSRVNKPVKLIGIVVVAQLAKRLHPKLRARGLNPVIGKMLSLTNLLLAVEKMKKRTVITYF